MARDYAAMDKALRIAGLDARVSRSQKHGGWVPILFESGDDLMDLSMEKAAEDLRRITAAIRSVEPDKNPLVFYVQREVSTQGELFA